MVSQVDGTKKRIYLSPPDMGDDEFTLLKDAFDSNWIAPLGPHVDKFEDEFASCVQMQHATALSSGTAAIHIALKLLGIQPGDEVLCSSLTFIATASPIVHEGAQPVFIDSDATSWNMDPALLEKELAACSKRGAMPRAVIVVDLYGQSADYDTICEVCRRYEVPIIEDAAEALGGSYKSKPLGGFGEMACFSFNGNKIITASGGGMLVSDNGDLMDRARFLATHARDPAPHYEHSSVGFNYRMSNLLAAVGRGQLRVLKDRVAARGRNFAYYTSHLSDLPGVKLIPQAAYGQSNHWLTCITVDPVSFGAPRESVRLALDAENIEARPVWKPLHLQPVFRHCRVQGGEIAKSLFERGLCLPSGSSLTEPDLERIVRIIRGCCGKL